MQNQLNATDQEVDIFFGQAQIPLQITGMQGEAIIDFLSAPTLYFLHKFILDCALSQWVNVMNKTGVSGALRGQPQNSSNIYLPFFLKGKENAEEEKPVKKENTNTTSGKKEKPKEAPKARPASPEPMEVDNPEVKKEKTEKSAESMASAKTKKVKKPKEAPPKPESSTSPGSPPATPTPTVPTTHTQPAGQYGKSLVTVIHSYKISVPDLCYCTITISCNCFFFVHLTLRVKLLITSTCLSHRCYLFNHRIEP